MSAHVFELKDGSVLVLESGARFVTVAPALPSAASLVAAGFGTGPIVPTGSEYARLMRGHVETVERMVELLEKRPGEKEAASALDPKVSIAAPGAKPGAPR